MIAVIFEVLPHPVRRQEYLDLAAELRPLLEQVPGFLSIERFESLTQPGKLLSLSFWQDEASVQQWRTLEMHRHAQDQGREQIFVDYRLRVAHVQRDYGMFDRSQVPADSLRAATVRNDSGSPSSPPPTAIKRPASGQMRLLD